MYRKHSIPASVKTTDTFPPIQWEALVHKLMGDIVQNVATAAFPSYRFNINLVKLILYGGEFKSVDF